MYAMATGVLIGIVGLLFGLGLGIACVDWYSISSFEGKSGFFVIGISLLYGIVGLVGGVVARLVIASTYPELGFTRSAVIVFAGFAAVTLLVFGIAYLLAPAKG